MTLDATELALSDPRALGYCPVGTGSLLGIARQQTNPSRWDGESWPAFAAALRVGGIAGDVPWESSCAKPESPVARSPPTPAARLMACRMAW